MNYFLDCEFYERPSEHTSLVGESSGINIDLISIGIVSEDGREFYAECPDAPYYEIQKDEWLLKYVLSSLSPEWKTLASLNHTVGDYENILTKGHWKSRSDIRQGILDFIGEDPDPLFWGFYADYDWVVFCNIFGRMIDLPKGWPYFCMDLKQELFSVSGLIKEKPPVPEPTGEHNALIDARWNRDLWMYLVEKGILNGED